MPTPRRTAPHVDRLVVDESKSLPATKQPALNKPIKKGLPLIVLDENSLDSVPEQIRAQLAAPDQMTRVIDFFRAMDQDGSGDVSRKEFVRAFARLGLHKEDCANLFDCFDIDGGGYIEYNELSSIVRRSQKLFPKISKRKIRSVPMPNRAYFTRFPKAAVVPRRVKVEGFDIPDPYSVIEIGSSTWLPPRTTVLAWERIMAGWGSTNRSSSKLALVTLPALSHETLEQPVYTGNLYTARPGQHVQLMPTCVLRSSLLRDLANDGYSILAYEAHAPGAEWFEAGEAATAYLLSALDYVAAHPTLRYCRISLFAQGVGATAALVALQRAPTRFDNRLKVIAACEPADEPSLLTLCAPRCPVPVLLLSRDTSELGALVHQALSARQESATNWVRVEQDTRQVDEYEPLDCATYLSAKPEMLLPFLRAHMNAGRDPTTLLSPRMSPRMTSSVKTFHLPPLPSPRLVS